MNSNPLRLSPPQRRFTLLLASRALALAAWLGPLAMLAAATALAAWSGLLWLFSAGDATPAAALLSATLLAALGGLLLLRRIERSARRLALRARESAPPAP